MKFFPRETIIELLQQLNEKKAGFYMFKLSDDGALKEISKLVCLGVLKSEGKGRSVRYVLD